MTSMDRAAGQEYNHRPKRQSALRISFNRKPEASAPVVQQIQSARGALASGLRLNEVRNDLLAGG